MKLTAFTLLTALLAAPAWAQTPDQPEDDAALTGLDIAQRMDAVDRSRDASRSAIMVIERGSQKLTRKMDLKAVKTEGGERSIIRFVEPADVRNTQYLSWTYDDPAKLDDMWVYFPTENLVRRISGGGKKGSFMRSDFSNEDIERRAVDDASYTRLPDTVLEGVEAFVIESTPIPEKKDQTAYSKRTTWVDKRTLLPLKVHFYDTRGRVVKTLESGGFTQIDGIWTATKLVMETPRRGSRTLMQYVDIRYNTGLSESEFIQSELDR